MSTYRYYIPVSSKLLAFRMSNDRSGVEDSNFRLQRLSRVYDDRVQNLHLNISIIESIDETESRGKEADNIAAPNIGSSSVLASEPTLRQTVMVWHQNHTFELSYNGVNCLLPLSPDRPFSEDVHILHPELPDAKRGLRV